MQHCCLGRRTGVCHACSGMRLEFVKRLFGASTAMSSLLEPSGREHQDDVCGIDGIQKVCFGSMFAAYLTPTPRPCCQSSSEPAGASCPSATSADCPSREPRLINIVAFAHDCWTVADPPDGVSQCSHQRTRKRTMFHLGWL